MIKFIQAFAICSLLSALPLFGQNSSVSANNASYTQINGTALDVVEGVNTISGFIPIGFDFVYFGQTFNSVAVSSNGYLAFNADAASVPINVIGAGASQSNIIAPLWDQLSGTGGTASFSTAGAAGSRVFTVEWRNWRWASAADATISFQAMLFETTGEIRFHYRQEAGSFVSSSASIGVVGNSVQMFYSLANASNEVAIAPNGFNNINARPATNQLYSFAPPQIIFIPIVPPSENVNTFSLTNTAAHSISIEWQDKPSDFITIFMKESGTAASFAPNSDQFYPASNKFGESVSAAGDGWFCVYNGTGTSTTITGLKSGSKYTVHVVAYNGIALDQEYNATALAANPAVVETVLERPTIESIVVPYYQSANHFRTNLNTGQSDFLAVFVKANTSDNAPVEDQTTYTGNSVFGTGSQIGSTGWYCVYNGPITSEIAVSGLSPATSYVLHAVDYNGQPGQELYLTSGTQSRHQFTTFNNLGVPYAFEASAGVFDPLTDGTAINEIEVDEGSSAQIPIGFTFYFKGQPFTSLTALSNGLVTFNPYGSTVGGSFINNLDISFLRPSIAALWDDLSGSGGQASFATSGTAPNRVFTVEYLMWKWSSTATQPGLSFQVKLFENDNHIELRYQQLLGGVVNPSASIGLAFATQDDFISLNNSTNAAVASSIAETANIGTKPTSGQVYKFIPSKLDQAINFTATSPVQFGNPKPTVLLGATATSNLPIEYIIADPAVATVENGVATIHKVGSTEIKAVQSGNGVFNPANDVAHILTVTKGNQQITFGDLPTKKVGDAGFALTASATSGLQISYESSNPAVATISAGQVTIVNPGVTTITAKQLGDANFNAAQPVGKELTVTKANQTILFEPLPTKSVGDQPFALSVSSSSGLPVNLESSSTSVATISGNTITIVARGVTYIKASQPGNTVYNAAPEIEHMLVVQGQQQITFAEIPNKTISDQSFFLSPTASSTLPVALTSTSSTISLQGYQVTILAPGPATITATQTGNQTFLPAPAIDRTFCIVPAKPAISVSGLGTASPTLTSSAPAHNQWFKDGVMMSGQTSTSLQISDGGIYTVAVIVSGCSSAQSDGESLLVTGIESKNNGIKIFPSPATNTITVDVTGINSSGDLPFQIIDMQGKVVLSSSIHQIRTIDISKFANGNYFFRLNRKSRMFTSEFVKH